MAFKMILGGKFDEIKNPILRHFCYGCLVNQYRKRLNSTWCARKWMFQFVQGLLEIIFVVLGFVLLLGL